jgi:hypothetical protein
MILLTPLVHVQVIRRGVRAVGVNDMVRMMTAPQDMVFNILKLSIAFVNRKANPDQKLPLEDGERVVDMPDLIGQVQTMVEQLGAAAGFEPVRLLASSALACYDRIHSKIHSFFHSFMA